MTTPFKKILSLFKEKQGSVLSNNSLTWTPDDKLIVCCSEKLVIINMTLAQHCSPCQDIFTVTTDDALSIHDLPDFSLSFEMLNTGASFLFLKDVERQQIMTDPLLIDQGFLQISARKIFKKAVCSSVFYLRGSYLIACVTYGGRVIIYFKDGHRFKPVEATKYIRKHMTSNLTLPLVLKKQEHLDSFINLMHSMSTVEIQWSQLFTFKDHEPFYLLICGSRKGDVHLWRTDAEFRNKEGQFVWQFTHKYQSEVMALSWLSKNHSKGFLAISFADGSIRCLEVTAICDPTLSITVKEVEIMGDNFCDGLSVTCMDFGKTSEGTDVLITCKQFSLHLYTVSDSDNVVKYCNYFYVDIALSLTSMCLRGMHGIVSPLDSAVIAFEVQETCGEISILQTRQDFELDNSSTPWFSSGATLTSSSLLCFSVKKSEIQVPLKQKSPRCEMVVMNLPFKFNIEKMMLNIRDLQTSTKEAVLYLCLHIRDIAEASGENPAQDEISNIIKSLQEASCTKGLQVALAVMTFLKSLLATKSNSGLDHHWLSAVYEESSKKRLSQYATSVISFTEKMSETDCMIISSLKRYWNPEDSDPLQRDIPLKHPVCAICGSEFLPDGLLTVKCTKGHKMNLCCLSCLPCQDLNIRKCETCGVCALSFDALADSFVLKEKLLCSLCGSYLREMF